MCRNLRVGAGSQCAIGGHHTSTKRHSFLTARMSNNGSCAPAFGRDSAVASQFSWPSEMAASARIQLGSIALAIRAPPFAQPTMYDEAEIFAELPIVMKLKFRGDRKMMRAFKLYT